MDTEQATGTIAEAEEAVAKARAALDESRQATKAAEETFRARRADEAVALEVYEQAARRIRDAYAAQRARIEEQMRTAEHELQALDARLSDLEVETGTPTPSAEPVSIEAPANNAPQADERSDAHHELTPAPDADEPAGAAYEDDWYRTLRQRSQNGSTPDGE